MILVSECLAGVPCRMDGKAKLIPEIKKLVDEGKAIAVCPEVWVACLLRETPVRYRMVGSSAKAE